MQSVPGKTYMQGKPGANQGCFSKYHHGDCQSKDKPCKFEHSDAAMMEVFKMKARQLLQAKHSPPLAYIIKFLQDTARDLEKKPVGKPVIGKPAGGKT